MAITNTGKGKDRMGGKNDGLRYKWRWVMRCRLSGCPQTDKRRLPCQTCEVDVKTKLGWWRYAAIEWGDSYEAKVELNHSLTLNETGLPTRLAAQQRAEMLATEFCEAVLRAG